jgi:hypothetical protein
MELDFFYEVADIYPICHLNAFDVTTGQKNVAIAYGWGDGIRYFDWMLTELAFLDVQDYDRDAFYEDENEFLSHELAPVQVTISHTNTTEIGRYKKELATTQQGMPTDTCENVFCATFPELAQPNEGVCPSTIQDEDSVQKPCFEGGERKDYIYMWEKTRTEEEENQEYQDWSPNVKSIYGDFLRASDELFNVYQYRKITTETETECKNTWEFAKEVDAYKWTGRSDIVHWCQDGGVVAAKEDSPFRVHALVNNGKKGTVGTEGCENQDYFGEVSITSELSLLGKEWTPEKYTKLPTSGDPRKIQTGSLWTAFGESCINKDKTYICKNLPTCPSGKSGAVIDDRCIIPMENQAGSTALFTLDISYKISDHQEVAETLA